MFGLLKRAEPDKEKINLFCEWFIANREDIITSVNNKEADQENMFRMLDEVEAHLAIVYADGYHGRIEFDYGFNGQKWDLNLYHLNKRFLVKATAQIADMLNGRIGDAWSVNVGK